MNKLPPVGLMLFSVGAGSLGGGGAGVVVVVVVVVAVVVVGVEGAWLPLVPHAAVTAPTAISTAPPATVIRRRTTQRESIYFTYLIRMSELTFRDAVTCCGELLAALSVREAPLPAA